MSVSKSELLCSKTYPRKKSLVLSDEGFFLHKGRKSYMKPFKTIVEQIDQLKDRDLTIKDEEKAKKYLLDNNYYNVINLYSKILQSSNNQYIANATFDEIIALHILDSEIKATLLKYLLQAEKHFKSIFAYYFSESYRGEYDYLKTESYNSESTLEIHRILSSVSKIIMKMKNSRNNNSIKHHINQYGTVPFWVIINELDLGTVKHMYIHSDSKVRNKVAKRLYEYMCENTNNAAYTRLDPNTVDTVLHCINDLRNCCAHNNKLWDFKTRDSIPFITPIYETVSSSGNTRSDCFSIFLSLQLMLSCGDFKNLNNTIRKRMRTAKNKIHSININIVLKKYGFPDGWHDKAPL